jgi:hypothetical protein
MADGGGHKFGGRKEQNKANRKSKRLQRKNGIGYYAPQEYPNGYFWMLPQINWEKGGSQS